MVSNVRRMPASNKLGDRLIAAAQVAGVLATAWFVWTNHVLPRLGLQSLAGIVGQSLFFVGLAWICGGIVTFCVYLVVSLANLPRAAQFSLRTSAPAMWFAPAIVLLSAPVAAAFAVSLFLVANATRQLIAQWGVIESPIPPKAAPAAPALLFKVAPTEADFLSWQSLPVLMGALTAQAGLVALLWRYQFRAASLFALSTAILTTLSIATGAYRPGKAPALPHSALSVVLTFLLAVSFTFGGISVRGARGTGSAASASNSPDAAGQGGAERANQPGMPPEDSAGFGGDFPGVILLPAVQPHVALLVPVLTTPSIFGAPLARPIGIPFSGAYWMYRWPAAHPPRRSVIRHGNAAELSFHTTDGWPMEMEAHQKLDPPIGVQCCSEIQLAVQNADPYPGSVSLEMILIDTSQPINVVQSLGAVPVAPPPPAEQILNFRMPPSAALQRFDEIKVLFHRGPWRMDKSARIAIERFVLAP